MSKKIKINLGCGRNLEDGFDKNIDCVDYGHNIICDIEHEKLPFKDDSIDYIYSNHVLEHLRDVKHCLNECWRVLKKDSEFYIKVPDGLWRGASKPVHFQCITVCWFDWLRREDNYKWYGYREWDILELTENISDKGEVYEVICRLKPRK